MVLVASAASVVLATLLFGFALEHLCRVVLLSAGALTEKAAAEKAVADTY